MAKKKDGLLYPLYFHLRWFDREWVELEAMQVQSSDVGVIQHHLRKWRLELMEALQSEEPQRGLLKLPSLATVEVCFG
jgi:hypothetical protein